MGIENNTVSAQAQVQKRNYIGIFDNGGKINVLFVGNSITRHEPKPEIGWAGDWGMAASAKEKDYVHVTVKLLEEKLGKINYCIANCGEWELNYYEDGKILGWAEARNFRADIVIIRIGENIWQARDKFAEHDLAPRYAEMVEYFCSNPNAKVFVTDLFWRNQPIDDAIRAVAAEKGYTLISLGDLGDEQENMAIGQFWHEGVAIHPNDNGMRKIAERIAEKIQ